MRFDATSSPPRLLSELTSRGCFGSALTSSVSIRSRAVEVIADDDEEQTVFRRRRWRPAAPGAGCECRRCARLPAGVSLRCVRACHNIPPMKAMARCGGDRDDAASWRTRRRRCRASSAGGSRPARRSVAALGNRQLIDQRQHAAERLELRAALVRRRRDAARRRRRRRRGSSAATSCSSCQVLHGVDLTNGSSDSRSLRTARKMVCFAALT